MINRQTFDSSNLQMVLACEAAQVFKCHVQQLRYLAWAQEVLIHGRTVVVTAEAWVKSPNLDGSIAPDAHPLPALVFTGGRTLGVAQDISAMHDLVTPGVCEAILWPKPRLEEELRQSALEVA